MTDIDYKVWDIKNQKMGDATQLQLDTSHVVSTAHEFRRLIDIEAFVLPFTGAYDKQHKKIYEGYLVRAYKPNSYLRPEIVLEVRWNPIECAFRYWNYEDNDWEASHQSKMYNIGNNKAGAWCEIVGNIFENSDLIPKRRPIL